MKVVQINARNRDAVDPHQLAGQNDEGDHHFFIGSKPQSMPLLGTVDARLSGIGGEDLILIGSKKATRGRHHSLDLNSVAEDDLRLSFDMAFADEAYRAMAVPRVTSIDEMEYQDELLLNVPKLGAMLSAMRSKGSTYYDKAQEVNKRRMEAIQAKEAMFIKHNSPRFMVKEAQEAVRKPLALFEPPAPQTKAAQFSSRTRPKSAQTNHFLRKLAHAPTVAVDSMSPRSDLTADGPALPAVPAVPVGAVLAPPTPRAQLVEQTEQAEPSISGVSQISLVRHAKAIPPPTFVSVCLPAVSAHQASNTSILEGMQRSASKQALPEIHSKSSLADQVHSMLREPDPPQIILPEEISAKVNDRRAKSAGGRQAEHKEDLSALRATVLVFGQQHPSIPTEPARRDAHSKQGISPRVRAASHPFPAGFNAVKADHRSELLSQFMFPSSSEEKPRSRSRSPSPSRIERLPEVEEERPQTASPKSRVMLLAHKIAQRLGPGAERSGLDAEEVQRLIDTEQKRDGVVHPTEAKLSLTDMVQAVDKQVKRFTSIKRPNSPNRHVFPASMLDHSVDRIDAEAAPISTSVEEQSTEELVLRWSAFVPSKPLPETKPAAPLVPAINLPATREGGSRKSTSRKPELKVLQFDSNAIAALFAAAPTPRITDSLDDEDYMNVHTVLAEYHKDHGINPQERVVELNPRVRSNRIDRNVSSRQQQQRARTPQGIGAPRSRPASPRHNQEVDFIMNAKPVHMTTRKTHKK